MGKNLSWSTLLKGKNLNDLINRDGSLWESPYIGTSGVTTDHSLAWYIRNANYDNSDICFPLISRGMFWHGATGDTSTINNIYSDSLIFQDIPPAVFHGKIVKKIFENIGWQVDGDLFGDEEYKRVILPYTTSDDYLWNWDSLVGPAASQTIGGGGLINNGATTYAPYYGNRSGDVIRYSGGDPMKAAIFEIRNLNSITQNKHNELKPYTFKNINGATITRIGYNVPATTKYDININFAADVIANFRVGTVIPTANYKAGLFLFVNVDKSDSTIIVLRNLINCVTQSKP